MFVLDSRKSHEYFNEFNCLIFLQNVKNLSFTFRFYFVWRLRFDWWGNLFQAYTKTLKDFLEQKYLSDENDQRLILSFSNVYNE